MCRQTKYRKLEIILLLGNSKCVESRKEQGGNHQGGGVKVRVGSHWRAGNTAFRAGALGKEAKPT